MRTFLLLIALLPALSLAAPGFDARVAAARAAVAMPGGLAYDMALVPAIHAAMLPCVPAHGDPPGRGFTLVADVDGTGRVQDAAVRPASSFASCFAAGFAATRLRPPPIQRGQPRHPIAVAMAERR